MNRVVHVGKGPHCGLKLFCAHCSSCKLLLSFVSSVESTGWYFVVFSFFRHGNFTSLCKETDVLSLDLISENCHWGHVAAQHRA